MQDPWDIKQGFYELLLDGAMHNKMQGVAAVERSKESPCEADREWMTNGFGCSFFPENCIPFKPVRKSTEELESHHYAIKFYALAERRGNVTGPPVALATIEVPGEIAIREAITGGIRINPNSKSLLFTNRLSLAN